MSERKGTKALELWCKRLVKDCPNVHIENMTTSWRDGIAFCALVHHFRPDLIDLSALKSENIYENNQLAYSIAEKHLGIPSLLDPEDMVDNEIPDRLSILTYLSQFYQRLAHTVNTKPSDSETKLSSPSSSQPSATAPIKFGKTGLDKCAACGLPVYLAQRLLVSHKLYHRRCFRCSKCSGHINPKNYELTEGSEFACDSCKNENILSKYINNNDQMGMLAFDSNVVEKDDDILKDEPISPKIRPRPQSILDKISLFENSSEKGSPIEEKMTNLSFKDAHTTNVNNKHNDTTTSITSNSSAPTDAYNTSHTIDEAYMPSDHNSPNKELKIENSFDLNMPEKVYKSNLQKFNFLQTQLSSVVSDVNSTVDSEQLGYDKSNKEDCSSNKSENGDDNHDEIVKENTDSILKEESNITDDNRIAQGNAATHIEQTDIAAAESNQPEGMSICVPPRRKKNVTPEKSKHTIGKEDMKIKSLNDKNYPKHLNPFSDDEDEEEPPSKPPKEPPKSASTNPFGSSDEEDDDVPPIPTKSQQESSTPMKRLIAVNPFWSDGEEPSSDEEDTHIKNGKMYKSAMTTSTPNLPGSGLRRKKQRAPPPPAPLQPRAAPAASNDDVASISSLSSYNSTAHSDQKSFGKSTPLLKKKRLAPTPADSVSTGSGYEGSMEKGVDTSGTRNTSIESARKTKGPAPGLPLPERREVKLQMSSEDLQVQLDMLETQQLGLERQGVLIEQMIRDKCEGDDAAPVPQEEVEDLVIQLCELVNEKNDLFRKQTELMYIRRQQRLEQEQADIEHEIRVIQSRPAVNRIDADKAREEQLVSRLVEIVRLRDELVQQIDAERRRERQEDLAIAASIASKRAQRNSESNSSSIKSADAVVSPKKSKVKDKVKKQLKKAKHTLISKKKEDADRKEEKEKKSPK